MRSIILNDIILLSRVVDICEIENKNLYSIVQLKL